MEGPERTFGQRIFDEVWRPLLKTLVRLTTWNVDQDGNCPIYIALIIIGLYKAMWMYHDYFHRYVFGEGDGGKLHWKIVKE